MEGELGRPEDLEDDYDFSDHISSRGNRKSKFSPGIPMCEGELCCTGPHTDKHVDQ